MSGTKDLLIIGCGNMGGAMLAGWLAAGIDPARFVVVDPVLERTPQGVALLREVPHDRFNAILLGVKPQMLGEVAPRVEPLVDDSTLILSILAGVELASLAARFPRAKGLVRIMPNLAAAIGKSPVALVGQGIGPDDRAEIAALMAPLGRAEWLADESAFDLVTALAGSGPAFVYRFIDALASGAAALGLDRAQAQRMALSTVEGAAALAARSDVPPGELARRVASPGGTTEAGLAVLDADAALARLVEATLEAAARRGAELAAAAR